MDKQEQFLRLPQVIKVVSMGRSTIWKLVKEGKFPKPRKISPKISVWLDSEIQAYIQKIAKK